MVLEFNKSFYNPKAVKAAIDAYRDFADFDLKDAGKAVRVIFKSRKNKIKDEFLNYALFLSLTRRNQNVK